MLQAIRDKATGWIAWVIVVLLIIPFAFWGLHEYFGQASDTVVADINGTEIKSTELDREFDRQTRGNRIDDKELALKAKKAILQQMVNDEVFSQALESMGYRMSKQLIEQQLRQAPQFQVNGQFDYNTFRRFIGRLGYSPEGFMKAQQREIVKRQFAGLLGATDFVTPTEVDHMLRLQGRSVDFSYVVISEKKLPSVRIPDAEIADWYKKNSKDYMTTERVQVEYVMLDIADLMKNIVVTDAELKAIYNKQKKLYTREPQRSISHIMLPLPKNATQKQVQAAMKQLQTIKTRIAKGEKFADLAKKESKDAGSARKGGSLGVFTKGQFGAGFDKAVASLIPGQVSDPVRTAFGLHLVRLDKVVAGEQLSFREAKTAIERDIRMQKAEKRFYDISEKLNNMAYDDPNSLKDTAEQLGLKLKVSGWITRDGNKAGLGAMPGVARIAFSGDVFAKGNPAKSQNSSMAELKLERKNTINPYIVMRLKAYEPSKLKPLKEVSGSIKALLYRKAVAKHLAEKAKQIRAQLDSGKSLADIARAEKLKLKNTGAILRNNNNHHPLLIKAAFGMGRPVKGKVLSSSVALPNAHAVMVLNKVKDGSVKDSPEIARKYIGLAMKTMYSDLTLVSFLEQIRKDADVEVKENLIKAE